jgi:hypothetical protein
MREFGSRKVFIVYVKYGQAASSYQSAQTCIKPSMSGAWPTLFKPLHCQFGFGSARASLRFNLCGWFDWGWNPERSVHDICHIATIFITHRFDRVSASFDIFASNSAYNCLPRELEKIYIGTYRHLPF